MCAGVQNPDSPRFSCTCHLEGPDLPEHEHKIEITITLDATGLADNNYPEVMRDEDERDAIIAALTATLDKLKNTKDPLYKILGYDRDTEGCECCEIVERGERPDDDEPDDFNDRDWDDRDFFEDRYGKD